MTDSTKRDLLRHTVATLAYRGGKAIANAPDGFNQFRLHDGTRTPEQILAHIGDLLDWALSIAKGQQTWHNSTPLPWDDLKPGIRPRDFGMEVALQRIEQYGDLFAPVLEDPRPLAPAAAKLQRLTSDL